MGSFGEISKCLSRLRLLLSSRAWASRLTMMFCSDTNPCVVTGVTGVKGDCTASWPFDVLPGTPSLTDIVNSSGGFGIPSRTLSGRNGNSPHAENPALMFLGVKALLLARLYRLVKCSLPIAFTPPLSSRSTSSRYADLSGPNTETSQGCVLWEVWEGSRHRMILFSRQNSRTSRVSC